MKCLTRKCNKNSKTRGLCARCYASAIGLVSRDKVSIEELEELNMILPLARTQSLFYKQLIEETKD